MPRIILNAVAITNLHHHFDVETGALFQALGLQEFAVGAQLFQAFAQFVFDVVDGGLKVIELAPDVTLDMVKDRTAAAIVD